MIVPTLDTTDDAVSIQPMTSVDIGDYCALFQRVFAAPPWNEQWTITKIEDVITKSMQKKGFLGLVARSNSNGIGYFTGFRVGMIPCLFYVDQLFIALGYQGKGIGKKLHAEATLRLKRCGVTGMILLTKPDTSADRFYRGLGYRRRIPLLRINGKGVFYNNLQTS
jgi:aminoglycoside 6'-N-acetyltransferase I